MSGLRSPSSTRRRTIGLITSLCVVAGSLATANPSQANQSGVVKVASTVVGSDGKEYSVTNHLTRQGQAATRGGPAKEWLLAWSGDAAAGSTTSPDPDFLAVIDATQGSRDYGKVVNTVTVDSIFGNEPHHMQYVWNKGHKVYAAGVISDTVYIFDVERLPAVSLSGIVLPSDTPCGSAPDAFTVLKDGTAYASYMGGPDVTGPCRYTHGEVRDGNGFAGSPGEVVRLGEKGQVRVEAPAATADGEDPTKCLNIPDVSKPTCANPHGIAVREDLDTLVTSDLVEIRIMILPQEAPPSHASRTSVRIYDIKDRDHPKLRSVSYLPDGPRVATDPFGIGDENEMVMETAVTNRPHHRGAFASTMSGGAVFYTPDITDPKPVWREVFDDYTAFSSLFRTDTPKADTDGGSWLMVSPDDRFLYRVVLQGGVHSAEANKEAGMVYVLDIRKLLAAGTDTRCSIDEIEEVSAGGSESDCPALVSALPINDVTNGGPHWAAMDNFRLAQDRRFRQGDRVDRLAVANYFVADTYIDGDHRVCMLNLTPGGKLAMDNTFRDEQTGTPCVDFDRTVWPHGERGAARPHGVLFAVADRHIR